MEKSIIIETSARHVHLTAEHVEVLFGKGKELTFKRPLSQPGQFLSEERVELIGPKSKMSNIAVLGPVRPITQVELSLTDARAFGVTAPIRESGNISESAGIIISGPCGEIELTEGVIIPKRHIHITPEVAKKYNLSDQQIVSVKIGGERETVFGETVVRVSPKFDTRMHIDFDEANGAAISSEVVGTIID